MSASPKAIVIITANNALRVVKRGFPFSAPNVSGSAGKSKPVPAVPNAGGKISKPVLPATQGRELFAQLDAAFSQDSAVGGRHNALQLLRASKAGSTPSPSSSLPGRSCSRSLVLVLLDCLFGPRPRKLDQHFKKLGPCSNRTQCATAVDCALMLRLLQSAGHSCRAIRG